MNSESLFTVALGLLPPWHVLDIQFDPEKGRIDFQVGFTSGARGEYDARELEVAEEENMGGEPPGKLNENLKVLHRLDAVVDIDHSPPTKQGGE